MRVKHLFNPLIYFLLVAAFFSNPLFAQEDDPEYQESCTCIMVGKDASTDGSVMTSHTCDAYYRTWLGFVPAQQFKKDTIQKIYSGTMHTHTKWSKENVKLRGEIPQIEKTYAYLNTAYPCINEKQLAIGETTISGKKMLVNKKGMFYIEELERIALQRCTTARQAIGMIGKLIKEYGYADAGECITIADKKEVWQLEIFGEGPNKIGGVWAAQRVPDDHICVAANLSRIAELKLKDKNYFMASENVFEVAKNLKLWDGKKTFKFWEAYSGEKPFTIREYFVYNTVAPGLNLKFDADELPFSVKPEKKVDIRDILKFFRATYDGTEWEMVKNLKIAANGDSIISPSAHPWMAREKRKMLNSLKPGLVVRQRPIAVQYCAYSWIAQLRDWLPDEVGGRLWFSFDVPRTSPRIPIYASNLSLPKSFDICGQDHFSRESALWAFRRANRLAMVKWGVGKKIIEPVVEEFENKAFNEIGFIEEKALELLKKDKENAKKGIKTKLCQEFLSNYSNNFARSVIDKWWELGDELWVKFRWKF